MWHKDTKAKKFLFASSTNSVTSTGVKELGFCTGFFFIIEAAGQVPARPNEQISAILLFL